MKSGYANIGEAAHFCAKKFGGKGGFFGDGEVGGAAGNDGDGAFFCDFFPVQVDDPP